MNTMADTPVPGLAPELPVQPAAAVADVAARVVPTLPRSTRGRIKDTLLTIYAYGLLGFGLFFPLLLAAWHVLFAPATR